MDLSVDQPEQARKITSGHADEDRASLSADGRWLVYTDNRENATAIAVRDLSTGEERLLSASRLDFGEPTGTLRLSVVEKQTGRPLTARLSIQQEGRKYVAPRVRSIAFRAAGFCTSMLRATRKQRCLPGSTSCEPSVV
jgi:hypothetical protein